MPWQWKKKKSIFLEDKEGTILFVFFFSPYCVFLNQKEDSREGESSFVRVSFLFIERLRVCWKRIMQ